MIKTICALSFLFCLNTSAQPVSVRLDNAAKALQNDLQMKHAMMSLYVVETKTGNPVYSLNEQTGLAAASTQKIFTSVASFELLGNNYRYKTEIGYDGEIKSNALKGNLYIVGYGDPSFGSWRFADTKREAILNKIISIVKSAGIQKIEGNIILNDSKFSYQPLPGGWIWEDIGNYYGAGTWGINWNENQYDLLLKPGAKEGDDVGITGTEPPLEVYSLTNLLKSGKPGSGDNGYIYMPPYAVAGFVEGTVPAAEKKFILSGSMPNPSYQLSKELEQKLSINAIALNGSFKTAAELITNKQVIPSYTKLLDTIMSPPLDSLNYWFLQKSINLYGEALIKTIAYQQAGTGSTDKGVEILRDFWSKNGIEKSAINIIDGSGLSPQNRVTTNALVTVLQYAKTRPWFNSFYNALPSYNNMKMKSGTIGGAKAYTGYHTAKNGTEYTFAIIINNYDADAGSIVTKMYKVLDELK